MSSIASVIGPPLSADQLTSKLDILPFARFCIEYKLGAPLPATIPVMILDPVSEEKFQSDVFVHYAIKPLTCVACHSLGHTTAACPKAKRVWVQKQRVEQKGEQEKGSSEKEVKEAQTEIPASGQKVELGKEVNLGNNVSEKRKEMDGDNGSKNAWTEVSRHSKHSTSRQNSGSPTTSATPPKFFKKLVLVDEIEAKKKQKPTAQENKSRLSSKGGGEPSHKPR